MDFVIARGFALPLASVFTHATWAIDAAPGFVCEGEVVVATSHAPLRCGGATLVFDGHAFDRDLFVHRAAGRPGDVAALIGRDLSDLGGAFCLVTVTAVEDGPPTITVVTDALGMYPLYVWRGPDGAYVLSNSAHAVAAVLTHNGRPPARSFLPCLANLTFNGPVGGPFLYEGVDRLPHGTAVSFEAGRLVLSRPEAFRYREDGETYQASIEAACAQMRGALEALLARWPFASVVMDLTGGADSRAMLGLMLSMGLRRRFGIRNIMHRPHPDAHVAALLADRYDLAVGESILPLPAPAATAAFEAFGLDAFLHGGARDGGSAFPSDVFLDDYIHLTGFYGGGLGGKTGAVMTLRGPVLRMSVPQRVDHLLARRRRVGQLDFVTDAGVERMREGIIAFYEGLLEQGARPDTLEAEAYLAGRCRTHFGLASVQANRRRIQPDLLGNPWLVRARRALSPSLAAHNKVVFDILRHFGGAELAFAPMAERRWDRSLVADEDLAAFEEMIAVGRDTPSLSDRTERLMKARYLPSRPTSGGPGPGLRVSEPSEIVYPADRTRRFSAALVRWAFENGAREQVGDLIDVDGVIGRIEDEGWRPRNIVQASFFDKLLPGLLWMIGAEAVGRTERRMAPADLPTPADLAAARAASAAAPATPARSEAELRGAARALLRTARTGELTMAGGGGSMLQVAVATMPDGAPLLASGAPPDVILAGDAMLRLAAEVADGPSVAGLRLILTGRATPVDGAGPAADLARRRFGARHPPEAPTVQPSLWRLEVTAGRLAGAEGTLLSLTADVLLIDPAEADALAGLESWALQRLNEDFSQILALIAMRLCAAGAGIWSVTGVDSGGLDLVRADGVQVRRLAFPEPVNDGATLKAMLMRLAEAARATPPPVHRSNGSMVGSPPSLPPTAAAPA